MIEAIADMTCALSSSGVIDSIDKKFASWNKKSTIPIYSKINNYGISEDINHIIMHLVMQYIKINNLVKNKKNPVM